MVSSDDVYGNEWTCINLALCCQSGAYRCRRSKTSQTEDLRLSEQDQNKPGRGFSRDRLPRSRLLRITLGVVLVIMGIFGLLPVVGFWMIPLGLVILSVDFHNVRRFRRRFEVWLGRRRQRRDARKSSLGESRDK